MRNAGVAAGAPQCQVRGRHLRAAALFVAALTALKSRLGFISCRLSRPRHGSNFADARAAAELLSRSPVRRGLGLKATDDISGISPEISAAGDVWTVRIEELMMAGRELWTKMKKEDPPKKIYFIGTNGNMGEEVAESLLEAMAYVPANDGSMYLNRKPTGVYEPIEFEIWSTDELLSKRSKISATDLFMEDEEKYREMEHSIIKEFAEQEFNGRPVGCLVGESALNKQENVDIIKSGLVIFLDVDSGFAWYATQYRAQGGSGLRVPKTNAAKPPVWAMAQGWYGDVDDNDAKRQYQKIVDEFRLEYEQYADVRIRTDVTGIQENSYWGAERLIKILNEYLGYQGETDESESAEIFEKDLEKFLEGARLSKYLEAAKKWCEEQGAATVGEVAENAADFGESLDMKPLEKKRLEKAAAVVAVSA